MLSGYVGDDKSRGALSLEKDLSTEKTSRFRAFFFFYLTLFFLRYYTRGTRQLHSLSRYRGRDFNRFDHERGGGRRGGGERDGKGRDKVKGRSTAAAVRA